jgi:hypothetical protein
MHALTADNLGPLLDDLQLQAPRWLTTPLPDRFRMLQSIREATYRVAERWSRICCEIKGIDPASQTAGQEWAIGPMIVLRNLRLLQGRLGRPAPPLNGFQRTFPQSLGDLAQWPGLYGETWSSAPGVDPMPRPLPGVVSLVLGAGNVSSIAATDILYKLFVEHQVVLLKMNPVHEPLGPVLEEAFDCLVREGFLRIVTGDGQAGALACRDPRVQNIHVTGASSTYEAIQASLPQPKTITAELGCVSPVIVFPGKWTRFDLAYQARHIAGMLTTNAGFNCNAAQVVVTSRHWPQRQEFLSELRQALHRTPARTAYYPGAQARYQQIRNDYPQAEALGDNPPGAIPWTLVSGLDPDQPQRAFDQEAFCGVLNEVALGADAGGFLQMATRFCNERLWGNLSCTLLIDPKSMRKYPWKETMLSLRYGAIGLNCWAGLIFALVNLPWGAAPGNPSDNIQSGVGMVHNTAGVEHPAKAVLSAPFRTPYLPPWHANHPRMLPLARALTDYEYKPGLWALLRAYVEVFRGSLPVRR